MALFENYEGRIEKITSVLNSYGIKDIEEAKKITEDAGLDVYHMVEGIQNICFENAKWAYTVGAAIAIKKGCRRAADAAAAIGEGLQAFCIPGSVADHRKVGLGHGNLGKMLLEEETECFCFLAGHESFAAAEGAIGIASKANKVRQKPLRVILNGLGKDAAQIISRINGFTFVETQYDYHSAKLNIISETPYSKGYARPSSATEPTMSRRALRLCTRRMSAYPSPAIPRTPPASSIPSQAPIRRSVMRWARSTSQLRPAAAPAVPCTRIIWPQARLLTV